MYTVDILEKLSNSTNNCINKINEKNEFAVK